MSAVLAVDFDNTIVSYDDLIQRVALEMELLPESSSNGKTDLRRRIRSLPNGEITWQELQAEVYGPRMAEAKLVDGVEPFFQECRQQNYTVYIVSHKTEYASQDDTGTSLRSAAMAWMTDHRFFQSSGFGLTPDHIFFEDTRAEKLGRIKSLGCSIFIDDLPEVLLEESFPAAVGKVLYDPHQVHPAIPGVKSVSSWEEIADYVFALRA